MKKYLVVDLDCNNNFQYLLVEKFDNGLKLLSDFQSIKVENSNECYDIIFKLMLKNDIDNLMIDKMGTGLLLLDKITEKNTDLLRKTLVCQFSQKGTHERLLNYYNDLFHDKLSICGNTYRFYNILSINNFDKYVYTSEGEYLKIDKFVDSEHRKVLHLLLTMYGCLNI